MINALPPILRDVLDVLNFEKWNNLRSITEIEPKFRRGEMQIVIAGYGFTVFIHTSAVVLEHKVRDGVETERVVKALMTVYGVNSPLTSIKAAST